MKNLQFSSSSGKSEILLLARSLRLYSGCIQMVMVALFLMISNCYGQRGFVPAGGNASNATGSISYSMGQVDYLATTNASGESNEGIQQPYEFFIIGVIEPDAYPGIIAYPNPTDELIFIELGDMPHAQTAYQLFDIKGKQLSNIELRDQRTSINLSHLSKGTYFLHVTIDEKPIKSFKILKSEEL